MVDRFMNYSALDRSKMHEILYNFPNQIGESRQLCDGIQFPDFRPKNIIVAGVGGSAIGGSLLQSWLFKRIEMPIFVNRAYRLPKFADENTLVFASSYSGNTEETLSLFHEAHLHSCRVVCISSGGKLEDLARIHEYPLVKLPSGIPPRTAVGYLLFSMIFILKEMDIFNGLAEVDDCSAVLEKARPLLVPESPIEKNEAKRLALKLEDTIPIIYGHTIYNAIAQRWKGQINENAKMISFSGNFPELDHNEIVGWRGDPNASKFSIVLLRDADEKDPIKSRVDITNEIIFRDTAHNVEQVYAEGRYYLSRMMHSLYTGDWVSYYLAILRGLDPTPVDAIDQLKKRLKGQK